MKRLQLGIASRLRCWLRAQNCLIKHDDTHYLDVSTGKPAHNVFVEGATTVVQQLRHFIVSTGYLTDAQFEDLWMRMQQEISQPNFYGVCPLHTVVAFNDVLRF